MFDRVNLVAFLREVDALLTRSGTARIIGGAVISLAHVPSYKTRDIDYVWADLEVDAAIRRVAAEHPELGYASRTGVYFVPDGYENRFETLAIPGLVHLRVVIPERHDLAIMKITRGIERDIEAVAAMHARDPFDLDTLVERYRGTWLTGEQRLADVGFRAALSSLFNDDTADEGMDILARLRSGGALPRRSSRRPRKT